MMKIRKNKLHRINALIFLFIGVLVGILFLNPVMMKLDTSADEKNEIMADLLTYVDFNSKTSFANKKNVLFFKASWCGTCSIADKNFQEELRNIPKNLTIYNVDFDREVALRKKYGVTVQHAFVQVDNEGNELKKWYGSYTLDEVLSELV